MHRMMKNGDVLSWGRAQDTRSGRTSKKAGNVDNGQWPDDKDPDLLNDLGIDLESNGVPWRRKGQCSDDLVKFLL